MGGSRLMNAALGWTLSGLLLCLSAPSAGAGEDSLMTAEQAREEFNRLGCNACHGIGETRLGPSFQLVARRYAGAPPEEMERLGLKIRYGGAGAWGTVPMVSYPGLSAAETDRIVRWILALEPAAVPAE